MEEELVSEQVSVERKTFSFTLKQNPRGRFLRISEEVGGRRNSIIIPATGLADFQKLLAEMVKADQAMPFHLAMWLPGAVNSPPA